MSGQKSFTKRCFENPCPGFGRGKGFQRSRLALSLRLTDGEFHQVRLPMGIMEFFEQHVRPRLLDEAVKLFVATIVIIVTG